MNFYQQKLAEKKKKHSFSETDESIKSVKEHGAIKTQTPIKPSKNFKRKQPL